MKNKQKGFVIPLIIIIVAVLGIGGGVYYSKKMKAQQSVQTEVNTEASVKSDMSSGDANVNLKSKVTFAELIGMYKGKNLMCVQKTTTLEGAVVESTTYFNGPIIRADSTIVYKGKTTISGMILKDTNDVYAWSGNQGVKATLGATFDLNAALNMASSTGASTAASDYTCTNWTVDSSKFQIPASVKFTDYGSVNIPTLSPEQIKAMMNVKIR